MKVFLSELLHPDAYDYLAGNVEIVDNLNRIGEVDGLITRNIQVDKALLDQARNLRVIGIHGTGIDDVDIEEAKRRNIRVYNVPKQNALSVAELNAALVLSLSRKLYDTQASYSSGKIKTTAPIETMGHEISNKTAGFIGLGTIAIETARILHDGFHMDILGYNRTKRNIDFIKEVTLIDLCRQSDYIILGMSLNKETYHFIDEDTLSYMKKGAYLINTARGALIDEEALIQALNSRQLAGFAGDVFENEPLPKTHPLLHKDNVVVLPHIGANTEEALYKVGMLCVRQMVQALNNEEIEYEIGG